MGNKFQEEVDFRAPGAGVLNFTRSYNSVIHACSITMGESSYGVGAFGPSVGDDAIASLVRTTGNDRYPLIGLDSIGANWRHTYQRMVFVDTASGLTSASVYRPDGRVLTFNLYNNQWTGSPFVNDRLTQAADFTFRFTVADTEEVEYYDAAGKLARPYTIAAVRL